MSASTALYHVLGVSGYQVKEIEQDETRLLLHIEPAPRLVRCPNCKGKNVIRRGSQERWFRNLPIGQDCTWFIADIPRVECRDCKLVRQIDVPFADRRRSYTRSFERHVLELSRFMTIHDVALHLDVSWDIVKDIQKRHLLKRYSKPRLKNLRRIAIDEICVGKGYRFLTIVLDLETGAIVFVGEGKKADSLKPFWTRLKRSRAKVEAVAIDMSRAYRVAVERNLPRAAIVFDRFHVVKLMNEKLTQLRRDLHREACDLLQKQVLKGVRWLLLKRPENLDLKRNEYARLHEALRLNEPLAIAYYLKEDLRQLWDQRSKEAARTYLMAWCMQANASGVRVLQEFAKTLLFHAHGILAWYEHPISTGPLEGTNNKIKTLNRQHYGLRDPTFFKLKLHQLHEAKYALVG